MSNAFEELDSGIREVFTRSDAGAHPSGEALAAYVRGELAAAESEELQAHLGPCRECTAAVLALEFPRIESASGRLPDAEVAADVATIVAQTHPQPATPKRPAARTLLAVAATLAVACISLALLTVRLQRQVGELEGALEGASTASILPTTAEQPDLPQTGVPIVDLYPSSVARGEAAAPQTIPLPAGASMVALILTPPSDLPDAAYEVRLLGGDAEMWRGAARPNAAGAFVVTLPRRFVVAGVDRVELYGVDGGSEQRLCTYHVRFEP